MYTLNYDVKYTNYLEVLQFEKIICEVKLVKYQYMID